MKHEPARATTLTRRQLLGRTAAAGALLAFHLPLRAQGKAGAAGGEFAPNAFIRIEPDGRTVLVMPQVEMGQGVYTSVALILAEELDADYSRVVLEHAPPSDKLYGNPIFGIQVTGNSNSIRAFWVPLRRAGAAARAMLVTAAAQRWHVDPASCTAAQGEVVHAPSGRKAAYGSLVAAARQLAPPANPPLKDPRNFTLIGKPQHRYDTPDKVAGKTTYGIDVMLPGMRFATIAASPTFGGRVASVDDSAARTVPGVHKVIVDEDLVAVVGDHMWAAKQGLAALVITWDPGPNAGVDSSAIWEDLRAASAKDGVLAKANGDVAQAAKGAEVIEADYELPFLAHATMEPMNCTVQLRKDSCEVWLGTQIISRVQATVAQLTGLAPEKVTVHNHYIGGGFGRRLEPDMALKAVRVARHLDGEPVKVVWTREEDIQHDIYRPVYRDVIAATLKSGRIDSWKYKISGSAVIARWLPPAFQKGIDIDAVDSAVDIPYDIPNLRVEYVRVEPPAVPTGFWRGVGPNNNVFATESFIDELARRAGKDPVAFRLEMLGKTPRLRAAVQHVAEKSGWGQPLPARCGRGISAQVSFGSFIATVVEAEVEDAGGVHLRRVTCAVDTGIAVSPDNIRAQLQGGLIFGLTAALYGEITIERGRVLQGNFHDYRILRMDEVPPIEVFLIESGEAPGGIGETGTTAGPPALRNAIYAATGVALRRLPIDRKRLAKGAPT
ncbi:MAG: xanthine dehydrogenase family protein molybdopterin-binding subunit [Proteobacteria bacterium]|nr:xanthine dehydrogenase family protein molybdopterin-binding subunit [Pseudomonadota bacterium]